MNINDRPYIFTRESTPEEKEREEKKKLKEAEVAALIKKETGVKEIVAVSIMLDDVYIFFKDTPDYTKFALIYDIKKKTITRNSYMNGYMPNKEDIINTVHELLKNTQFG